MRLTCFYIQKKFHICSALEEKKSLMPLKQAPGGNFIWLRKCCSCGPLDFAASCLILFQDTWGQRSKFASEEMTGTPATGSMWGRGARNSFILAFLQNRWRKRSCHAQKHSGQHLLASWILAAKDGMSTGCSEWATDRRCRWESYALLKNQLVKRALEGIWNFVCGICVRGVISFGCVCLAAKSGKVCLSGWWVSKGWRELWVPARPIAILCFVKTFVEGFSRAHLSVPVFEVVLSTSLPGLGCCYPRHFPEFTPLTSSCYCSGLLPSWRQGLNPSCSHSSNSILNWKNKGGIR